MDQVQAQKGPYRMIFSLRPVFIGWITLLYQLPRQLFFTLWVGGFFGGLFNALFKATGIFPEVSWIPFVFFGALAFFGIPRVIGRRGFQKTTMQDVVAQSGLSPGSIYCHFAGKQDIIVAVVEERHRRERALLQRAFEKQAFAEAIDQLAADFVAALRAPEERAWRRLTVQLRAESLHNPRLAVTVRDGVEGRKQYWPAWCNAQRLGANSRGARRNRDGALVDCLLSGIVIRRTSASPQ